MQLCDGEESVRSSVLFYATVTLAVAVIAIFCAVVSAGVLGMSSAYKSVYVVPAVIGGIWITIPFITVLYTMWCLDDIKKVTY
jgi:ABC-type dipeptide/oligopeptide/nickel transport system permease subunit